MSSLKSRFVFVIANILLLCLFLFLMSPLNLEWDALAVIVSFPSFFFGIFIAFILTDRYERFNSIKKLIAYENSHWRNIIQLSKGLDNKKQIFNKLDDYFCSLYDYYLEDYHYTEPFFENIRVYFMKINFKTKLAEKIVDSLSELNHIRQESIVTVRDKLSTLQWIIISLLTTSLIVAIFLSKSNHLILNLFFSLFIVLTTTILSVIRTYDQLKVQAEFWNWEVSQKLFDLMEKPRYYPKEFIDSGGVKPPSGVKFRLVTYLGKYPDNIKKIKVIRN